MKYKENLAAWEALVVTAKTGSISQTAALLDMDLPKASRLLAGLEKEVGFTLFDKSHRPIVPTPECARLLQAVTPLVEGFREVSRKPQWRDARLVIRFTAPIELQQIYFSDMLCKYSEMYPNIEFSMIPEVGADQVRRGEVDVAVLNYTPADVSDLEVRPYFTSNTVPLASREYLAQNGVPKNPADLEGHTGLLLKTFTHEPTSRLFKNGAMSEPLRWKRVFLSHDQSTLRRLVLDHRGVTVDLFVGHVLEELMGGLLVPVLSGWEREPWYMCVVTRKSAEAENPQLRNFARWLASTARVDRQKVEATCRRVVDEIVRSAGDGGVRESSAIDRTGRGFSMQLR